MTLKEMLGRGNFQYLKILNHDPDLSRIVTTVESTETPDVAKYIPQNTFLLMTGMAFKDDPVLMCTFLEGLDKRKCAGIAIKLGRFIDTLDDRVIETADQLRLPVFQIPMEKTLGNVYQEILSYIWNNQNDYLLGALNAQQKISSLILQGNSLKSIVNNMSVMLNRPVMIMDMFDDILEYGYTYTKIAREQTMKAIAVLAGEDRLDDTTYSVYEADGRRICAYPVRGVGRNTNYVIIADFDPGEKEEHVLIMEQIITALKLYFYKNLYVKYNEMKLKEKFLNLLLEQLENMIWTEKQMLLFGDSYGLKRMSEYRIVFLEMRNGDHKKFNPVNFSKKEERYILTYDWIRHLLNEENDILIFPQESKWRYVCLIQGEQKSYRDLFIQIHDVVRKKFEFEMTILQGSAVSSFMNIKNSYSEAEQCAIDGNRDEEYPFLMSYKPKNMMELFKFIPEREVKDICEITLKELAYPKNQMEEELRKTLFTFLFNGNSITKTADSLYVHRNTIKYRLKKCEELLGVDFSDVFSCFQIQMALVLTEYAQ